METGSHCCESRDRCALAQVWICALLACHLQSPPDGRQKKISKDVRDLIFRMVRENPTWGAPRIHGELLMLGFDVSERTISRCLHQKDSESLSKIRPSTREMSLPSRIRVHPNPLHRIRASLGLGNSMRRKQRSGHVRPALMGLPKGTLGVRRRSRVGCIVAHSLAQL
jgi:hypothetical protein